jgi:hypothetical protein
MPVELSRGDGKAGDFVLGSFGSGIGQGAVESASGVAGKPAASLDAWSLAVHWQHRLRPDAGLCWAGTASPLGQSM